MKITDPRYICALEYATKKHDGQIRMNGNPFIIHPIMVSEILIEFDFDKICVLAGLLHDVSEECKVSYIDVFNFLRGRILTEKEARLTADVVSLLSKDEGSTPEQTIQKILSCKDAEVRNRAIAVKLADILANTLETIILENTEKNIEFKFKWHIKARSYLKALESVWKIELQKGIKGYVYKKEIYNALNMLVRSTSRREMSEVSVNVSKRYLGNKDIKRGIA